MSKYALQKVEIRNNIPLEEAEKQYKDIVKKKPRKVRESKNFYQFRHLPPTKFEKKSFKTKVVNKDIRLIYGELKPEHHHLEGGGLFDYFKKGYDYTKNAVISAFTINDYSSKTKRNLQLYGDVPVIGVEIRRKPLKAVFELGFTVFSAGQWDKLKDKYGFDKFFHLSMIVTLQKEKGGAKREMGVEKLEVVSFNDDINYKPGDGTEVQPVNVTTPFTVREMFDKTRARVGDKTFFSYSGVGGNNCQDFIAMCLTSVGLYGAPEKLFTYQDMASLTGELHKGTKFVARTITQLGALANKYLGVGGNHEGMEEMEAGVMEGGDALSDLTHQFMSFIPGNAYKTLLAVTKKGKGKPDEVEEFYNYVKEHHHDLEGAHTLKQMYKDYKEMKGGNQASGFIRAMMARKNQSDGSVAKFHNKISKMNKNKRNREADYTTDEINHYKFDNLDREGFKLKKLSKTTHDLSTKTKELTHKEAVKAFHDYVIKHGIQHQPLSSTNPDRNYRGTYDLDDLYGKWKSGEKIEIVKRKKPLVAEKKEEKKEKKEEKKEVKEEKKETNEEKRRREMRERSERDEREDRGTSSNPYTSTSTKKPRAKPKKVEKVEPIEMKEEKKEKDINFVKRTNEILSGRDVKDGSSKLDGFIGKYVKIRNVPGIHKIVDFHADRSGNAYIKIMYNGKLEHALVFSIEEIEM